MAVGDLVEENLTLPESGKIKAESLATSGLTFPQQDPVGVIDTQSAADQVNGAQEKLDVLDPVKISEDAGDDDLAKAFEDDAGVKATGEALETAEGQADELGQELSDLRSEIDSFRITDVELKSQVDAISSRWDARIVEMRDINKRREQAFETLGFRTGARFSGGVRGGVFGGVVAEEERKGILRIGQLEAEKQAEIAGAKAAQRQQNWNVFVQKVNAAQSAFDQQIDEVAKLNNLFIEQQDEIRKEREAIQKLTRTVTIDNAVASLFAQGITDPAEILNFLNFSEEGEFIGDVSIADIKDTLTFLDKMKVDEEDIDPLEGVGTDVKSFAALFPDLKIGTTEFQQGFLRFKAQLGAAGRAPPGPGKPPVGQAAVNVYGSTVDEALAAGASPEEAVFAAVALADATGTKLSIKDQNALLEHARRDETLQTNVASGIADFFSPFETTITTPEGAEEQAVQSDVERKQTRSAELIEVINNPDISRSEKNTAKRELDAIPQLLNGVRIHSGA